jgi:hypothetical protein
MENCLQYSNFQQKLLIESELFETNKTSEYDSTKEQISYGWQDYKNQ